MSLVKRRRHTSTLPNFFDDFFTKEMFHVEPNFASRPAVNIKEGDEQFTIELAAPGLEKANFKVELEQNSLQVAYESKAETEEVKEKFTRKEFSYGKFKRSFTLPENSIDSEAISVDYVNGILAITLPKKEEAKLKRVFEVK